ncbi:acetyltransferase component of pyruvate dehydrogenase complex [Gluconacetobacter liquefaciens]|uniref:Acetyltransferase component of pyruvate dehydrogenase complex n=1 Tax=Gluconacetobacter liquefaciens TaxID=89584 RepID=A0A370FYL3_GLULI|nr:pyruvate dehydrogenase complex dihydrolipoamide acetyltransferase [Gluconacetobacter liquefaciens]MBB2187682.1 pyruvate dehydrogenase complex dihydrolipoamide acetyltransferase [Gluconacetobacter liquefaciens]RDI36578.1 pyruvate dehydrogenase E2 component (dihydrolipoamide acetyltransferase) [Gluconacetobacter liquefaciens]GBQ93203.1 dihydrolipoamide acetyltransferase component [Gluconacetobacter liquefaciens NRIC 0522]GEB37530.1 acetyltransferase component of pyruvate dehydrogenase complex 
MSVNILMPALSPTMTEGKLARWLKKEGEAIASGDVIAEIETDKATMEVEAVDEGTLGRILVEAGTEGVKVNAPIAILVADGEAVPDGAPTAAAPEAASTAPAASPVVASAKSAAAPAPAPAAEAAPKAGRVFASPLARRIAAQKGVDLVTVKGSGPNGRIVRRDVEAAVAAPVAAPAAPKVVPQSTPTIDVPHTAVPNSSVRKVIARRLTEAKSTIPHFYVAMDVELDALLALRAQLNASSPAEGPGAFKLSVNDLLIKAVAVTLRRVPKVNASYTEDATILYDDVDVSVAVSVPDGLITPIIRNADRKSLSQISNEAKELIARARAGKLKPQEFQGGSFSISNMGMYGVKEFSAIINPPQAAILAIAAGEKRAVVKGDALAIATVMTVTLSVDHRVVDGALAAEWVAAFRSVVESPLSLVV